jgi:hypothetical protein
MPKETKEVHLTINIVPKQLVEDGLNNIHTTKAKSPASAKSRVDSGTIKAKVPAKLVF